MDHKNFTYFHVMHDQYVSAFTLLFFKIGSTCILFVFLLSWTSTYKQKMLGSFYIVMFTSVVLRFPHVVWAAPL